VAWPIDGRNTHDAERALFEEVCRRADALTRLQTARRVLTADGVNLLETLAGRHRVQLAGFTGAVAELPPDQLASDLPSAGEAGGVTDLRAPLTRAQDHAGDAGPPLAVILLTDGQHNAADSPVATAADLGERGVPVYPVAIGTRVPPTDIAVTGTQSPASVFKGSDVAVEARVQVNGIGARELVIELQRPGRPPLSERLWHDGKDRSYTVRFQARLDDVGTQALTVVARPAAEETRPENNSRTLAVNVADDKAKVLLIDGEGRWEYHYLASALARDRGTETHTVLFAQPRSGRLSDADLVRSGHPARQLPADPYALTNFDCVILGDVRPAQLSAEERARLERYVSEHGGTLVVVAGQNAMPAAFVGEGADAGADPLARLLPVERPRAVRSAQGFPVIPTADGKMTGFLQMESTPEESERRWSLLPRHFWGTVGRAKPGATVLASYRDDAAEAVKEPGAWERDNALIARQNYGLGRVLFVGLESTWRWRFKAGDTYHHRFWGQAIRWAASDKPLLVGNEFLRFGPRKPAVAQGQEVELIARLSEAARRLGPDAPAAVRVIRQVPGKADEPVSLVTLTRPEDRPRELQARLRDLPPGQYAAELVIPDLADQLHGPSGPDGRPAPLRAPFAVSPRDSTELTDLALNLPLLDELAAKSGGQVYTPETAADLGKLLARREATRTDRVETRLWRSWWALAAFVGLMSLEWIGRKWAGLP
jgi:hypothetical protein